MAARRTTASNSSEGSYERMIPPWSPGGNRSSMVGGSGALSSIWWRLPIRREVRWWRLYLAS